MNCIHTESFSVTPTMTISRDDGKSYTILIDESKEHMMGEIAKSALLNQSMIIGQDVRGYENYFHFLIIGFRFSCLLSKPAVTGFQEFSNRNPSFKQEFVYDYRSWKSCNRQL